MPVIDNIRLVDRLASDAAAQERRKLALDIHDSVIQPYIGLQMGLTAINERLGKENVDVSPDIKSLIELTDLSIADLRGYALGLKVPGTLGGGLLSSIHRFARTFQGATGIAVRIEAKSDIEIADRLAAEVFQMVEEGLSNIRRQTQSERAAVGLECFDNHLILRISNEAGNEAPATQFNPRSMTERAEALGGRARVEGLEDGGSVVIVEIPL